MVTLWKLLKMPSFKLKIVLKPKDGPKQLDVYIVIVYIDMLIHFISDQVFRNIFLVQSALSSLKNHFA